MPIFLMINKNMGFNMPKDRTVNIVNMSAYFVCVLYIWCAMIVSIIKVVMKLIVKIASRTLSKSRCIKK